MTTENVWVVGLPADAAYLSLSRDVTSAIGRSKKAEPGDGLDIARMEALATQLEQAAVDDTRAERFPVGLPEAGDTMLFGTDPAAWPERLPHDMRAAAQRCVDSGLIPVLIVDPFRPGPTATGSAGKPKLQRSGGTRVTRGAACRRGALQSPGRGRPRCPEPPGSRSPRAVSRTLLSPRSCASSPRPLPAWLASTHPSSTATGREAPTRSPCVRCA